MATKALNYTTAEINQRLNLAGTAVQPSALNDYYTKTEVDGKVVVDLSVRYSASYANLSAALVALNSDTATDASAIKKGGVSIKFINSTTNKYEQWNLKASSWSTNESDWVSMTNLKAEDVSYGSSNVKEELDKITGYEDKDISNSITSYQNGYWDKITGDYMTYGPNGKTSGKIDISDYDVVKLSNLGNYTSISTARQYFCSYALFGNNELIEYAKATTSKTINRTDYSQYQKLEVIVSCYSRSEVVEILVTKYGINSGSGSSKATKIVCVGDSLTNNYPTYLAGFAIGYEVSKCQMGSETSIANLTRMGGLNILPKNAVEIPASGSTIPFAIVSDWINSNGENAKLQFANIDITNNNTSLKYVVVEGIKGTLAKNTINARGLVVYNSNDAVIASYYDSADVTLGNTAAYIKVTINANYINAPHLTLNGVGYDIVTACVNNGYINNNGSFVSDNGYLSSDAIPVSGGTVIYADGLASSESYIFTRENSGESRTVSKGSPMIPGRKFDEANYIHIIYTGQNGGYTNAADFVKQLKAATFYLSKDRFIICTTHTLASNSEISQLLKAEFGDRYFNLRAYLENQSVYDAVRLGYAEEGDYTPEQWQEMIGVQSQVHENAIGSKLIAGAFWNHLVKIGLAEGDLI